MRTPCARLGLLALLLCDSGRSQRSRFEGIEKIFHDPDRHGMEPRVHREAVDPSWDHAATGPSARSLDRVPDLFAFSRQAGMFETGATTTFDRHALAAGRGDLLTVETVVGAYAVIPGAEEPFGETPKGSPSEMNSRAASVITCIS